MLHIIDHIQANPADHTVTLFYRGQAPIQADFKPLIRQGGVMAALADPAVFVGVRIGPRGRSLAFGEDIEFCADGLWEKFGRAGQAAA